jgi:hypothetical protein
VNINAVLRVMNSAFDDDADSLDAERARIAEAVDAVLSDEPVLDPTPPSAIWRWYSEGWNRCARDVRAAAALPPGWCGHEAEIANLRTAFARWGDHGANCPVRYDPVGRKPCNCGYPDARAALTPKPGR